MGPWEDMNALASRAAAAGRASAQLGDSAYSSAEDWQKRQTMKPNFQGGSISHSSLNFNEKRMPFDDRRKSKRLQLMQSILDYGEAPPCKRCDSLQNRMTIDRKLFYQEIEHMRRGVHKMLDTCANYMSTGAFLQLRDSLQLGVRFLTEHAAGEIDTPVPAAYAAESPSGGARGGKDADELQQTIAKLEDEVSQLEKENTALKKELAVRNAADSRQRASTLRGGAARQNTEVQTDPVFLGSPGQGGGRAVAPGEPGWEAHAEDDRGFHRSPQASAPSSSTKHRSRQGGGGGGASHLDGGGDSADGSDEGSVVDEFGVRRKQGGKKKKAGEKHGGHRASDESHKEELERLRRMLADRDKQLAEAQKKAAAATAEAAAVQTRVEVITIPGEKAAGDPGSPSGSSPSRRPSQVAAESEEKERAKKGQKGQSTPGKEHGKSRGHGGSSPSSERAGERSSSKGGPGEARPSLLAQQEREMAAGKSAKPEMVDKCVGGGPEPPPPEPPPRVRGRSLHPAAAPEQPLNKTGTCFQRSQRSEPNLGASVTSSVASPRAPTPVPSAAATLSATAKASTTGSQPARAKQKGGGGGTYMLGAGGFAQQKGGGGTFVVGVGGLAQELGPGSSKFSADLGALGSSTRSLGGTATSWDGSLSTTAKRDAEPYLLQVWEQRPQGHKQPVQTELQNLGAMVPSPPQLS